MLAGWALCQGSLAEINPPLPLPPPNDVEGWEAYCGTTFEASGMYCGTAFGGGGGWGRGF